MSHLISAQELVESLSAGPDAAVRSGRRLRLIDASFVLTDPAAGRSAYESGHLPGAVYFDLDQDLSDPEALARHRAGVPGAGGRHPLPDMRRFAEKLGARGIGSEHEIVVYDQDGGMFAARAWWLLRYAGHAPARFLDGGLRAYVEAGGALTTEVPEHPAARFDLEVQPGMVMNAEELSARLNEPGLSVIDARAAPRYRGEVEPLDAKAGHVPGAVNLPHATAVDGATGRLLPPPVLAEVLALPVGTSEAVAYCGSGVSAAHLILALEEAGTFGVKLYPGSWSDWSSRPELPVATGPG